MVGTLKAFGRERPSRLRPSRLGAFASTCCSRLQIVKRTRANFQKLIWVCFKSKAVSFLSHDCLPCLWVVAVHSLLQQAFFFTQYGRMPLFRHSQTPKHIYILAAQGLCQGPNAVLHQSTVQFSQYMVYILGLLYSSTQIAPFA